MRKFISLERLKTRLAYDPKTGVWTWLVSFNNGTKAGDIAGDIKSNGHRYIGVDGRRYLSSRLAWFYITGEWPLLEVDHKDTDPANDRWGNLREATRSQNIANTKSRGGECGFKGVTRVIRLGSIRYAAQIMVNRRQLYLGHFATPKEAHEAYKTASYLYFGEFARTA